MFVLAHLSDPHLGPVPTPRLAELAGKRALGFLNWHRKRRAIHRPWRDVTAFLSWASEPTMEQRKRTGIKVILFLLIFTGVFFVVKRRVWKNVH